MRKTLSFIALIGLIACLPSYAAIDAGTMPNLNNAIGGSVTTSGTTTFVKTEGGAGAVGQYDWNHFNVGKDATVNFQFTGHSQTALNRVLSGKMSEIYGKLMSSCASGAAGCGYDGTSKVILINPNGLMFGDGSLVNLNSFTASTFDAVGAKNIKDLTSAQLEAYKNGLSSKFGSKATIQYLGSDSAKGAAVTLDNSNWTIDKSAAIVAKDINLYKGSKIATSTEEYNYGGNKNFSNVKLVTSNGVDFEYVANGYIKNSETDNVKAGLAGEDYNVNINDSEIKSGSVFIKNRGMTDKSDIKITKSAIKGTKLMQNAYGDIYIVGNNKVAVKDSTLETFNSREVDNHDVNTFGNIGGNILVRGGQGVEIDNTTIATAYSTIADEYNGIDQSNGYSGDVVIDAAFGGNAKVTNSTINAKGGVKIDAKEGKAVVDNSLVYARQQDGLSFTEDASITGKTGVDVSNSDIYATGNVAFASSAGDVNLNDNPMIDAGKEVSIIGKNSLIKDSALTYNTIKLHNGTDDNNVTIKGNSTFKDKLANKLEIDVKGNLTIDNAKLQTKTPYAADEANQNEIALNATKNIDIINSSNVQSKGAITAVAGAAAKVDASQLTAGEKLTVRAQDNVSILGSILKGRSAQLLSQNANALVKNSKVKADETSAIQAKENVDADCADVDAKSNTIVASNGYVALKDTKVKASATNNINAKTNFTAKNSIVSGNKNVIAAKTGTFTALNSKIQATDTNDITAKGNVEFKFDKAYAEECKGASCIGAVDKTEIKGKTNKVTSTDGDVIVGGEITPGTTNPEDTVTILTGKKVSSQAKVVYDNLYDKTGTIVGEGPLNTNGTKVVIESEGDVNLVLTNTANKKAGLEILNGKKVELIAQDDKLAISRIKANDLYIHDGNKFIAGETTITNAELNRLKVDQATTNPEGWGVEDVDNNAVGRGYIVVDHGFNFDWDPSAVEASGMYQGSYNSTKDDQGAVTGYQDHMITLDNTSTNGQFVLVYKKPFACEPLPDIEPDFNITDDTSRIKIPLQADNITNPHSINNNMTDPLLGVIAAAAGIEADEEDQLLY